MDTPYAIDLQLSPEKIQLQESFEVIRSGEFHYLGSNPVKYADQFDSFLKSVGRSGQEEAIDSIRSSSLFILRQAFSRFANDDAFWISSVAYLPTNEFEVPLWHIDGDYYETEKPTYTISFSPTGAVTRFATIKNKKQFIACSRELSEKYNELVIEEKDEKAFALIETSIRKRIASTVQESPSFGKGLAVVHQNGGDEATAHSKPHITVPRLFVAVVVDVLENGEVYLRQQGNNQKDDRKALHLVTMPRSPPEMSDAMLETITGSANPPGDAR